jgi:dipeptidyl aminopeptidase/acylaminoacyl peptidase
LHWSPDGDFIAVALAPTSLVDDHYMNRKVHVVHVETGQVRARIDTAGKIGPLAWSPDGSSIALIAGEDRHDPSAGRLMVAPRSGGTPVDILPGFEGEVARIAWRDKDTLLYIASKSVDRMIGQVGRDGANNAELIALGGPILERWSLTPDASRAALIAHSPEHPTEVYLWSPGDAHVSRATHHNLWLSDIDFGNQEVVSYQAIDGTKIDGLLIHPVKRAKTKRVPLIVTVHGGPESHYRNGWLTYYSMPGQIAAGRNMAVFYPNYRGSTGRGVAFSKTSQGDPAGHEFDDIVDGIDHLVELGLVDSRRVASIGGSYGGYASAWAATYYTDRYAASAVFVGVTDLVSKIGTTDIPQEMNLVHYRKDPWTDWQFFLERSPIYHAGKSRTPTIILHGDADPRVHPSQSLELYRHLKLRSSAPVRLILYPGEGHGNRRAASRVDYMLRVLRWFGHYLQGPGGDPPDQEIDYNAGLGREN